MFKVIIYSNSIKEFEKINPWKDWLDELPQQIQNRIIPYQLASDRQMRILGKIQLKQLLRDFSLLHEDGRGEGNIRGMATIFDLNNLCYSEFNKPYFRVDATHLISEQSFYFNKM